MIQKTSQFTWATAWGAPLNAAVETTLTAPPPSSRPSSGWSVTWTTRYVTCKNKKQLDKKPQENKLFSCFTVQTSQKKSSRGQLTLAADLFIMSVSILQQSLQPKSLAVRGARFTFWSTSAYAGGKQYADAAECVWFNLKTRQEKWTYLFRESLFVFYNHVTLLLTDMWQQPRANPRPDCNHMTAHTSLVYA